MKEILVQVGYSIVTVFGMAILIQGVNMVNEKIDKFQKSKRMQKEEKLNKAIDQVQAFVTYAVEKVGNTYVNSLKASGTFTDDAKKAAESQAIEIIKPLISKADLSVILKAYSNIEAFLSKKITETVDSKKSTVANTDAQQSA